MPFDYTDQGNDDEAAMCPLAFSSQWLLIHAHRRVFGLPTAAEHEAPFHHRSQPNIVSNERRVECGGARAAATAALRHDTPAAGVPVPMAT